MVFQIIGLCLLTLFYGCYFWKMLSQRKRGIDTDQLGKGKQGVVRTVELLTKLSTYLVAPVEAVMLCLNVCVLPVWARITGVVLGFLGVVVFALSVVTMGDSWRAGVPEEAQTKLVTSGIYAWSRNPAFLGFDLLYIGLLLLFFHWGLLVPTLFAILMLHLQIVNVEEDFLREAFGEQYESYQKQVNRYFGRKG